MSKIKQAAMAGTLESNDVLVNVFPGNGSREVELESIVFDQFGDEILEVVNFVLDENEIDDVKITLNDRGALNYTIKARVQTALDRGTN